MDNWDEIRTAYQVARVGTVSGAADILGVHHATVIRHIDALEKKLGTKLFQRHARGYTPTEAGDDLMQVAQATDDQFTQLSGRIRGQGETVQGDLIVTSLASLSDLLSPILVDFQKLYPDVRVHFLTSDRVFRLEYGEAHVAIRAGNIPDQPDNVVQELHTQCIGLYGSQEYFDKYGKPKSEEDLKNHRFVAGQEGAKRAPFYRWLDDTVPQDAIVFRGGDFHSVENAVVAGAGLGFLSEWTAERHPEMVQVFPPRREWKGKLWLVTHVDLHRTLKVQTFLKFLKTAADGWGGQCNSCEGDE
ncbi:LysR family transcriptional regulator [Cochlodiniinecator piscidefendens]|uniref:LysR family transcriptional regulator n=1 Tax=Cochlodiniinecator piscidefendens TaxID=2715756 RepID=UPI00140C0778|nr:LysR family transcriptional regulator [Cochlodiniinecator piscidefendens]